MSSKQVDERVLSMQFDNKLFERNISTTMSSLDKLKQKLNLSGAAKGLDNINAAAKNVNMTGLGSAVETVRMKFSSLQVMAVTALANITNSVVNAGKQMLHSLTVAPVKDGFSEYEMTLNAIQTTMSATGKTAKQVEDELKRLDEYADKTVYSTSDMLNNLPKFTNAGVELEKATTAMIGIANATALAGGDASKASIAFYNLGQAIGTGYLTRMDYNSINNAGIATMEWKNQMVDAAIAAGTLTKAGDDLYQAGNKTFTLQQLFIEGLQEQWATTDVMMKVFGDYGDETTAIGKKAYASAQDVKTFSQMMESLKATAGTGWKETWQLIFGGLDEAKTFWTGLSEFISGIIVKMTKIRNGIVESALGRTFTGLTDKLSGVLKPIEKTTESVKKVTKTLKNLGDIADDVILGKFNVGTERYNLLTKAGYNYYAVQNKVNEKLGDSFRYTKEQIEAQDKLLDTQTDVADSTKEEAKERGKLTDAQKKQLASLSKLTDAELKDKGYKPAQIEALRELTELADKLGMSVEDLLDNIDTLTGKNILFNSFKNIGDAISGVFNAAKDAWKEVFNPGDAGDALFNVIAGFHKLTSSLKMTDETADNLKRTFKGVFALLDIITTITNGAFKITFKVLTGLLDHFDLNILDITASIGDAIVKFRDWLDSTLDFTSAFEKVAPYITSAVDAVKEWVESVKPFEKIASAFKKVAGAIKDFAQTVWNTDIVQGIITGLTNGLKKGAIAVWEAIVALAKGMITKIKNVLGIHSPSTEFEEVGENAIQGLIKGLFGGLGSIVDVIKTLCSKMFSVFDGFNWSNISTIFTNIARLFPSLRIFTAISAIGNIFAVAGKDVASGFVNGLGDGASSILDAIANIAISIINKFKEILGIHSPSTKFFEAGQNVIQGLINGIKNGASALWDTVKSLFSTLVEYVQNIDFGALFAAGLGIGMLVISKKLLDVMEAFAKPFESIGGLIGSIKDVVEQYKGVVKSMKFQANTKGIKNLAISVGILAASVYLLAKLDWDDLARAGAALAGIIVVIGALALIASKMNMIGDADFGKLSVNMLAIAGSLLLVSMAVKKISSVPTDKMLATAGMLVVIGGVFAGLIAISKFSGKDVGSVGTMLLLMSAAFLIMGTVIKRMAKLEPETVTKGLTVIALVSSVFAGLIAVSKLAGQNAGKAGTMLLLMSGAFLIMVSVIKQIDKIDNSGLAKGIVTIAILGGVFAGLVVVSKYAGKHALQAGAMLLLMAGAFLIMTTVIRQINKMDNNGLERGLGVIAILSGLFAAFVAISYFAGEHAAKAGTMLLMMAGAMAILAGVLFVISKMEPKGLMKALGVVVVLETLMIGLVAVTYYAKDATKTLALLLGAIALLTVALVALTFIDPRKLAYATGALSGVLTAFALLVAATKFASDAKGLGKTLLLMMGVVVVLGGIVAALTLIKDPGSVITTTTALSILLTTLVGALFIVSKVKTISNTAIGALALLGLIVAELAVILGVMSALKLEGSLTTAASISLLLSAMAGVMVVLGLIGPMASSAYSGIGAMALLGLVVAELAVILGVMAQLNITPSIETASSLSVLLLAMSSAMVILGVVGMFGAAAFIGILALAALIVGVGGLIVGIGALSSKWKDLETFLNIGIPLLEKIGYAIGSILGNLVAGFISSSMSVLPQLGTYLSEFITNAMPFIEGIKNIDAMSVINAGLLAGAIVALSTANLIAAINSFLSFGASFATLGTQLSEFVINAMPFIMGIKMLDAGSVACAGLLAGVIIALSIAQFISGVTSILMLGSSFALLGSNLSAFMVNLAPFIQGAMLITPSMMNGVKTLAESILILTKADVLNGLTSWLTGGSSLADFGLQLADLGAGMRSFVDELGDFTGKEATVDCACRAITAIANAAKKIPNDGGLMGSIFGENNVGTFGGYLPQLGTDLKNFANNLGTFDEDKQSTITCASEALVSIAKAAKKIPNDGGAWGAVFGENNLGTFSGYLPGLGTDISMFATNLGSFDDTAKSTIESACDALVKIASAASEIPNEGKSFVSFWVGDNSISTFSGYLPQLGTDLKNFAGNLGTFTKSQVDSITCAVSAINSFTGLANADLGKAKNNFGPLGNKIVDFAEKIKKFADAMSDVGTDMLNTAITKLNKVAEAIRGLAGLDDKAAKEFKNSLKNLGECAVDDFVSAFTSADSTTDVKEAAKTMIDNFIKGIESKLKSAKNEFQDLASETASSVKTNTYYKKFKSAGKYLVEGFCEGISENDYKAEAKARAMARAAADAAEDELDINSPSKVFRKIGTSVPEGFIMGIDRLRGDVGKSATSMAKTAISSVGNSISRLASVVNSDIDAQPTIRPVLDLSDVRSGAGMISNILGSGSSVGVLANINSVNSMMNRRSQNGANDDVISELKRLGSKLDNRTGDTYQINGVTYDDGSNITDAVKTIVRAARIERRV